MDNGFVAVFPGLQYVVPVDPLVLHITTMFQDCPKSQIPNVGLYRVVYPNNLHVRRLIGTVHCTQLF